MKDDYRVWCVRGIRISPTRKIYASFVRNRQLTSSMRIGDPRRIILDRMEFGWFLTIHLGNYFLNIDWC